jgi:hypothetical protein
MSKTYSEDDLKVIKGHIMTADNRYYLGNDGDYDYWHSITSVDGDHMKLGFVMGHYAYDYCFRSNLKGCLDKLNCLISRHLPEVRK